MRISGRRAGQRPICQELAVTSPHVDREREYGGSGGRHRGGARRGCHAYFCYEQKLAKNRDLKKSSWDVTDASAGTAFIPETPPEIRFDDDLGGQALVFRRVDITDGGGRTYYVGRRAVRDAEGDLIVLSWQTPIFKEWMRAKQSAPGKVLLRRLLSCDGRQVNDYSDEFVADQATANPGCQP